MPVVNKDNRLICFAYEDFDANREIRMLRELSENTNALQFGDIYPKYEGVRIYEFNELAYLFAEYLKKQNIAVQVYGDLWRDFFESTEIELQDYKYLLIYAEGIQPKKADWMDNLLDSVSMEFECIDHMYEMNIKNHIVQDAGGGIEELLDCLKEEKEIIIIGSGREAQDVYDFLFKNNIDICCFVNENYEEQLHKLFGKDILCSLDARNRYTQAVFIECMSKHSAWGFGNTDIYDYMGYRRNKEFYLIKDYVEISGNGLTNILKLKKVMLIGDVYLCNILNNFFVQKGISVIECLDVAQQYERQNMSNEIDNMDGESEKGIICLIVIHEFFEREQKQRQTGLKRRIVNYLKMNEQYDYSDYFSSTNAFIDIEQAQLNKYSQKYLIPKKIILGSIESNSGNTFIRGLLDGHPSVLMIHYCHFNNNLFWLCICLSRLKSDQVLDAFWRIYNEQKEWTGINDPIAFNVKMQQLLAQSDHVTSQELFVIFHISYMFMNGYNINENHINNLVIYWEPHHVERSVVENFVSWLGSGKVRCDILNIVRNIVMRYGAVRDFFLQTNKDKNKAYYYVMNHPFMEQKEYRWSDRIIVKFEELKKSPRQTLLLICDRFEIPWSDTLMSTTRNGVKELYDNGVRQITGFSLAPVYNINEMYFSEFDRLRIAVINSSWQRKYGYPYLRIAQFTRRELSEMFLKKFRFEELDREQSAKMEREFRIRLNSFIRYNLQKIRMTELTENWNI